MERGLFLFSSSCAAVRDAAILRYRWTTYGFFAFMALVVYANYLTVFLRGGILDNALPAYDSARIADEYVKRIPGFNAEEIVPIIVRNTDGSPLSKAEFELVLARTRDARKMFGPRDVGIATIPRYRDTGSELRDTPYVSEQVLERPDFTAEKFRKMLSEDTGVWKLFAGDTWAVIGIVLPPAYNEPETAWRIVEFIEGRAIPWWERLVKSDIYPAEPRMAVSGWVLGRWAIDQGLNKDMLMLPSLGVLIAFPLLWWWLGSIRQAFIGVAISILSGILITRGSIALFHYMGIGVQERVYTLLAEANVIVQGFVCMHKFEAFREARGTTALQKFMHARHIDTAIIIIAVLAGLAFTCLFTYPVWQLRELALVSMVGVGTILIGSTMIVPAVYLWAEEWLGSETAEKRAPRAVGRRFAHIFLHALGIPPWASGTIAVMPLGIAGALFMNGLITANTAPLDYITGTLVEQTHQFLKREGAGNDALNFYVESEGYTVHDVHFLENAWKLQNALRPEGAFEAWQKENGYSFLVSFVNVGSVLDSVAHIAAASYRKNFLTTNQEAGDVFTFLLPGGLPKETQNALWHEKGIRLTAADVVNESNEERAAIERVVLFAKENFSSLRVTPFGKMALYPYIDAYITGGQVLNILVTLAGMFGIYAAWIFIHGRRYLSPVRGGLILLVPFIFSAGMMGCLMAYKKIPLSMSTAPIFDLAVNAAADFSVYLVAVFLLACRMGKPPREALRYALFMEGAVVFMDFALNAVAFSPLLASQFEPVRELGWMMMGMLACCGVGVLILVPPLLAAVAKNPNIETEVSREKDFDEYSNIGSCYSTLHFSGTS